MNNKVSYDSDIDVFVLVTVVLDFSQLKYSAKFLLCGPLLKSL